MANDPITFLSGLLQLGAPGILLFVSIKLYQLLEKRDNTIEKKDERIESFSSEMMTILKEEIAVKKDLVHAVENNTRAIELLRESHLTASNK